MGNALKRFTGNHTGKNAGTIVSFGDKRAYESSFHSRHPSVSSQYVDSSEIPP